ncbi:MAG: hypothetical protein MUE55_02420 [Thermoplasmata archaeon]|nr:hypothetical protein [Thermoplasmata archaeon]
MYPYVPSRTSRGPGGACLFDWLYNILIVVIALIWLVDAKYTGVLSRLVKRRPSRKVLATVLWICFLFSASVFAAGYDYFERSHDVDDAVEAAADAFLDGTNPYVEPVVPRFAEMGHFVLIGDQADGDILWAYGPYNYLPLDLLFYSSCYGALGWLGSPTWFVLVNVVLAAASMYVLNLRFRADWLMFAPAAGMVVVFLAFDNSALTLLLMVVALHLRDRSKVLPHELSLLVLGLATLTKIFAAIPLAVVLIHDLQTRVRVRDISALLRTAGAVVACGALALVVLVPFGVSDVLDSTVFIYSSGETREDRPMGGTLLSELMPDSPYYSVISIAAIGVTLLLGLRLKSINDRVLLVSLAFLAVSVKSTLAPFVVPALFLSLRVWESRTAKDAGKSSDPSPRKGD